MDIRRITDGYAVSGQIDPQDAVVLREAGFTDVICNRPDNEIGPDQSSFAIRQAVEAAGMVFHDNAVSGNGMTAENVALQGDIIDNASGPVFAYCRSGTRSTFVWALSRAKTVSSDALIEAAADAGYDLSGLRPQLEMRFG